MTNFILNSKISIFRGGLLGKRGDPFQGVAVFTLKKKLKYLMSKKVYQQVFQKVYQQVYQVYHVFLCHN